MAEVVFFKCPSNRLKNIDLFLTLYRLMRKKVKNDDSFNNRKEAVDMGIPPGRFLFYKWL